MHMKESAKNRKRWENKVVGDFWTQRERIEDIIIGTEVGEQQVAEKRRMKMVFSLQLLSHKAIQMLSYDCVGQRNVR